MEQFILLLTEGIVGHLMDDTVMLNIAVVGLILCFTERWERLTETIPEWVLISGVALMLLPVWTELIALIALTISVLHEQVLKQVAAENDRAMHEKAKQHEASERKRYEKERRSGREEARAHDTGSKPPPAALQWWLPLGLSPDATVAEIKTAYRTLVKDCHPDTSTPDEDRFKELTDAYDRALRTRTYH